jgi:hypothetical protein
MAGFVTPKFDETKPYVEISGRFLFYNKEADYIKLMKEGQDQLAIFIDMGVCIGSTNQVDDQWPSSYSDLKINNLYYDKLLSKEIDIAYVLAYNSDTKSVWNVNIMDCNFDNYSIDFIANTPIYSIPEPATLILLGLGAVCLFRKK